MKKANVCLRQFDTMLIEVSMIETLQNRLERLTKMLAVIAVLHPITLVTTS